jgi:hypothetical protein
LRRCAPVTCLKARAMVEREARAQGRRGMAKQPTPSISRAKGASVHPSPQQAFRQLLVGSLLPREPIREPGLTGQVNLRQCMLPLAACS